MFINIVGEKLVLRKKKERGRVRRQIERKALVTTALPIARSGKTESDGVPEMDGRELGASPGVLIRKDYHKIIPKVQS